MVKRRIIIWLLLFFILFPSPIFAQGLYQDSNRFAYGFQRIAMAPFRILINTLQGTLYGPPIVGTLGGVLSGTVQTVTDLVGGAFDMAAAAAPYAKYALLF